jgi:hypothetical protein
MPQAEKWLMADLRIEVLPLGPEAMLLNEFDIQAIAHFASSTWGIEQARRYEALNR